MYQVSDLQHLDDTGFTPIDIVSPSVSPYSMEPVLPFFQCIMCFGIILPATPTVVPPVSDPFEHHRDNCYGWKGAH